MSKELVDNFIQLVVPAWFINAIPVILSGDQLTPSSALALETLRYLSQTKPVSVATETALQDKSPLKDLAG